MPSILWRGQGRKHPARSRAAGVRAVRLAIFAALTLGLAACSALPRSGPLAIDIDPPLAEDAAQGLVAPLSADVANMTAAPAAPGFPRAFLDAPALKTDLLGAGDIIDVTIWEGAEGGLFSGGQGGGFTLPALRVDEDGSVFIPFAGSIKAAGGDAGQLRRRIRQALAPLTLSPEVSVRVAQPLSRRVTLQGAIARPGALTIERGVARLTPMLAVAGGPTLPPEQISVVVRRDGRTGVENLARIYIDPTRDIALRPYDTILLSRQIRRFSVLGATSIQAELEFPEESLNLLGALGAARGLRDFDADPRAVFVFRWEDPKLADALLPGPPPEGLPEGPGRPIVYRLNMTDPEALFVARRFQMRDGDAIFVSNAPLAEMRKFLQLFTSVLMPVQQTSTLAP